MTPLEILEEGHKEAEQALVDLKALWVREDEATAANRAAVLEAHAQGARDRDAVRVSMGGASVIEAEKAAEADKAEAEAADAEKKAAEEKAAAERLAESEAAAKRTSDLPPPQPLQALEQPPYVPLKP